MDLGVRAGEIVALFGANGAGKTTLLRCLASLTRPDRGRILVRGTDLSGSSAAKSRARLGFVGHQTLLYDSLTAEENLIFYASLHGLAAPRRRARALLEEFGLDGRAEDAVGGFSRGMQQRLSIARALLHDPDVLLLDEPTTGLDPSAVALLRGRVGALRSQGRSGLIVSHDVPATLAMADRYLLLAGGRIAASGSAAAADPDGIVRSHFTAEVKKW